jgi:hypothetical protein
LLQKNLREKEHLNVEGFFELLCFVELLDIHIRDICKARKRQGEYPEVGHTQGEIKQRPAKKYISIQGGVKLRKFPEVSPCISFSLSGGLSFFFPERLHCCYVVFHCSSLYSY